MANKNSNDHFTNIYYIIVVQKWVGHISSPLNCCMLSFATKLISESVQRGNSSKLTATVHRHRAPSTYIWKSIGLAPCSAASSCGRIEARLFSGAVSKLELDSWTSSCGGIEAWFFNEAVSILELDSWTWWARLCLCFLANRGSTGFLFSLFFCWEMCASAKNNKVKFQAFVLAR